MRGDRVFLGASNFFGAQSDWLNVAPLGTGLQVSVTSEGDVVFVAGRAQITLTISSPAEYAGTYVVDPSELANGAVNLVPPVISGATSDSTAVGQELSAVPGLWVYDDKSTPPELTSGWYRDGVPIPDAVAQTYVLQDTDVGTDIGYTEIYSGPDATVVAESSLLPVPVPAWDPSVLFEAGEIGIVILPGTSFGACYQEITGAEATTPCLDGDPVGTYHCLVTGRYAVAPSDEHRMRYRQDATGSFLEKPYQEQLLQLPLDFSGSDEVVVCALAEKTDGAFDVLLEHKDNASDGYFNIAQSGSNGEGWTHQARGTQQQNAGQTTGFPAGASYLVTGQSKISGPYVSLRVNGTEIARSENSLGSGTFADDTLYIGGRNGAPASSFTGKIRGLIVCSAVPDAETLAELEACVQAQEADG